MPEAQDKLSFLTLREVVDTDVDGVADQVNARVGDVDTSGTEHVPRREDLLLQSFQVRKGSGDALYPKAALRREKRRECLSVFLRVTGEQKYRRSP